MKKTSVKVKTFYDEMGNKRGVLMSFKTFEKLMEELEDLHDTITAYEREKGLKKAVSYEEIRKEVFGPHAR